MGWQPTHHIAHCPRCDIVVGAQGHDPAGTPCSRCGATLIAQHCRHPVADYIELRPRRADPATRRAQCTTCDALFVWRQCGA